MLKLSHVFLSEPYRLLRADKVIFAALPYEVEALSSPNNPLGEVGVDKARHHRFIKYVPRDEFWDRQTNRASDKMLVVSFVLVA